MIEAFERVAFQNELKRLFAGASPEMSEEQWARLAEATERLCNKYGNKEEYLDATVKAFDGIFPPNTPAGWV